jgi:hypothetical protein
MDYWSPIFAETLRQIESLPDTEGGGMATSRHERKERIEFCYKRRDMLEELQTKTDLSLKAVREDIQRLTDEERTELNDGPKSPSFRRRASDILTGRER